MEDMRKLKIEFIISWLENASDNLINLVCILIENLKEPE